jgi:hypothetical protein
MEAGGQRWRAFTAWVTTRTELSRLTSSLHVRIPPPSKEAVPRFGASNQATRGTMAARLGDALWWLGLLLGAGVWIALLALAHSAGPIDEAVFWASLIAALPIGFGYLCRYILSGKAVAPADTVLDPATLPQVQNAPIESGSRPRIKPGSAQASMGRDSQRKDDAAVREAPAVKLRSRFKSPQKSRSAVARAKKGTRFKVKAKRRARKARFREGYHG